MRDLYLPHFPPVSNGSGEALPAFPPSPHWKTLVYGSAFSRVWTDGNFSLRSEKPPPLAIEENSSPVPLSEIYVRDRAPNPSCQWKSSPVEIPSFPPSPVVPLQSAITSPARSDSLLFESLLLCRPSPLSLLLWTTIL